MNRLICATALLLAAGVPLQAAPSPLSEVLVDVHEDAQPIRDVLRRLEQKHGLNYVVSEDVLLQAGTVTVRLTQVPLDVALEAICSACGLTLQIRGPILIILPRTQQRPELPAVREGIVPEGASRQPTPAPRPGPATGPRAGPPLPANDAMAVGSVLEVDLPNGRLQLRVDGMKRDFYLPGEKGADPKLQGSRLRAALGSLQPDHRVALLYRRETDRSVITNLIGGSKVREATLPTGRKRTRRAPRRADAPPPPPDRSRGTPETPEVPDGILAGRFVEREGDVVRVRRPDGSVVEAHIPPAGDDPERRAKIEARIDTLAAGAKVFLTYEQDAEGVKTLRDTGITQVGPGN